MAFTRKQIVRRIRRFFNYKLSVDSNMLGVKFQLPGFSYADLDRTGQINLYSLNRLLETNRLLPYAMKNIEFFSTPTQKTALVMLGQRFSVQPYLYQHCAMDFPMELDNMLISVGKSAIVKRVSLIEVKTGIVLASVLQKLVHMDMSTKKSCPLTEQVLEMFGGVGNIDVNDAFKNIDPQHPPSKSFECQQMVKYSDMDYLMHTNQAAYMRFAFDCAAEAASKKAFSVIKDDICKYQVTEANTLHMSEAFAGDTLNVNVWEDEEDPHVLHCAIFKDHVKVFYLCMKVIDDNN